MHDCHTSFLITSNDGQQVRQIIKKEQEEGETSEEEIPEDIKPDPGPPTVTLEAEKPEFRKKASAGSGTDPERKKKKKKKAKTPAPASASASESASEQLEDLRIGDDAEN